jgi:two-component system nitrate/nitrite response regulator NarL
VNILLVDDHTILREGVASFIESDELCDVLFSTPDIGAARTIIEEEKVDLVITDLNFPQESGLMLLDYLKAKKPEVPAIVLSMQDDHETIQDTLKRGPGVTSPRVRDSPLSQGRLKRFPQGVTTLIKGSCQNW